MNIIKKTAAAIASALLVCAALSCAQGDDSSGGGSSAQSSKASVLGTSWAASNVSVGGNEETLLIDVDEDGGVGYTLISASGEKATGTSASTIEESGGEITLTFTVTVSGESHTITLVWGGASAQAEVSADSGAAVEATVASDGLAFYVPKANETLTEDWHEEADDDVSEKVWCTYKFTSKDSAGKWAVTRAIYAQAINTNATSQRGRDDTSISYDENTGLSTGDAHRRFYQTSTFVWGQWEDDPSYRKTDSSSSIYGTYESDDGEILTITRSGMTTSEDDRVVFTDLNAVEDNAWSIVNTHPITGVATTYYMLFDGSGTQKFLYKVDKFTKS